MENWLRVRDRILGCEIPTIPVRISTWLCSDAAFVLWLPDEILGGAEKRCSVRGNVEKLVVTADFSMHCFGMFQNI